MSENTYICPERVERDGWLVAFEGERMSMDEAVRRGLVPAAPEPAPADDGKSRAELVAEAESLGVDVPKKATKDQIRALIEACGGKGVE